MTKYIPYILILVAFILGLFSGSGKDAERELMKQIHAERKMFTDAIKHEKARAAAAQARQDAREIQWEERYAELSGALKAEKRRTADLKKQNEKINYQSYSNPDLDSIDAILFGPI